MIEFLTRKEHVEPLSSQPIEAIGNAHDSTRDSSQRVGLSTQIDSLNQNLIGFVVLMATPGDRLETVEDVSRKAIPGLKLFFLPFEGSLKPRPEMVGNWFRPWSFINSNTFLLNSATLPKSFRPRFGDASTTK
jgi:hypothetical protein